MVISAALLLFLTITLGAIVAGFWSHPERWTVDRRSSLLGSAHVAVGLSAVAAWVVYLIARDDMMGTIAVIGLAVTAGLGTTTLLSTRRRDRTAGYTEPPDAVPLAALILHGAAAAAATGAAIAAIA